MRNKKLIAALLVSAMTISSLAGCAGNDNSSTTEAESGVTTTAQSEEGTSAEDKTTESDETKVDETEDDETKDTEATESETTTQAEYKIDTIDPMSIDFSKYVDVSGWKDVTVKEADITENEDDIKAALIEDLTKELGIEPKEVTGRAVELGDTATIDFVGRMDGEEFEGGSSEDFPLGIGSHSFIEGFEEGIIGMEIGEKKTLELSFPDPYPNNPDLAGKPVEFDVTVKSISRFDIETVTDEDIKEATDGEVESFAAYEQAFRDLRAEDYKANIIWEKVMEDGVKSIEICSELSDNFVDTYLYSISIYAGYFGMTVDEYIKMGGYDSLDDFKKEMQTTADAYALQTCAVLAIADMEGITPDKDEVDQAWEEILEEYENDEEAAKNDGYIYGGVEFDNILEKIQPYIIEHITVE